MDHLSEVVKILEGALRHDPRGAREYGLLLADKLEGERKGRQAEAVRRTIARVPGLSVGVADVSSDVPRDEESDLRTLDLEHVGPTERSLALPRLVRQQVDDFVQAARSQDLWTQHGIDAPARLLLTGPPGTGKTQLARQIAAKLNLPIAVTRSDVLVSSLLGQTSRNLRRVFDFVSGRPCVLFLDELDALAKRRDDAQEVGELQRVVIALLQNLDALSSSTVVIGATNHPELLDKAVGRRFAFRAGVPMPARAERTEIWRERLGSHAPDRADIEVLAAASEGMSGAMIEAAAMDARRQAVLHGLEIAALPLVLRRLARILWYDNHKVFETAETEMSALRRWLPRVFTYRTLAEQFDVTTRQVGNAIRSATGTGTGAAGADEG